MILALLLLSLAAPDPFVRSRVKPGGPSAHCLWWEEDSTLMWRVEESGNPANRGTEVDAIRKAFAEWNTVMGACSSLRFEEGPRTRTRVVGDDHENVVMFLSLIHI